MKSIPANINPPLRLMILVGQHFGTAGPDWMVQAPGRDMWVAASLLDGYEYEVASGDLNADVKFSHRSAKVLQTVLKRPLPGWARYPAGVVATLGDGGLPVPTFRAVVLGDEPTGPRYDFALGVVFAALCHAVTETAYAPDDLVDVAEQVRRTFVQGGR